MSKNQSETLDEIEKTQAQLAATIEESKRLIDRSQQLLDCHKKKGEREHA